MILGKSLNLASAGQNDRIRPGDLVCPKGQKIVGIGLEFTVPLANSSGGSVTLNAAQKRTLLGLMLMDLWYGADKQHQPIKGLTLQEVRQFFRDRFGSEVEGWSDSTDGLATALPNSATTSVKFTLPVPTGRDWHYDQDPETRNLWGMGPTQAKSVELEVRRGSSDTVLSGVVISGAVTVKVLPYTQPAKGDIWSYLPEVVKRTETTREIDFADGMVHALLEDTAVHASTSITAYNLNCDDVRVHGNVTPAQTIREINDSQAVPSAAILTDELTVLFSTRPDMRFRDALTGKLHFEQITQVLATVLARVFMSKIPTAEAIERDVVWAAKQRNVPVRAISMAAVDGLAVPSRLAPYVPMVLVDQNDREWEQFAGLRGEGDAASIDVPPAVAARVKALVSANQGSGATKTANAIAKEAASMIPGAVKSGRGFRVGQSAYLQTFKQLCGV